MSKKSRLKKQKKRRVSSSTKITPTFSSKKKSSSIRKSYFLNLDKLLLIPIMVLIISISLIGLKIYETGEFVEKSVSLKGGISLTLITGERISVDDFEKFIQQNFASADYSVRAFSSSGKQRGLLIEITDVDTDELLSLVKTEYGLNEEDYTLEQTGSSLGERFFSQTLKAMAVAFILMGAVVFLYFGDSLKNKIIIAVLTLINAALIFGTINVFTGIIIFILSLALLYLYITKSIPSFAVILAGVSTILMTLATFNLLGFRLTTGGIAAFLMLIGYSVDTDILLTTRILKTKEGNFEENVLSAMKTGLTMTLTTLAAITVSLFIANQEMLRQIMTILFIGLIFDILNTWIQNVAVIKLYLKKVKKRY